MELERNLLIKEAELRTDLALIAVLNHTILRRALRLADSRLEDPEKARLWNLGTRFFFFFFSSDVGLFCSGSYEEEDS